MSRPFQLTAIVLAAVLQVGEEGAGQTKPPAEFVGHTYRHTWVRGKYAGNAFEMAYLSDDMLRWTGLIGPSKGNSAEENYEYVRLAPSLHLIVFKEVGKPARGLPSLIFAVFTYDFEKKVIHGVINEGPAIVVLEGTFIETHAPAK